MIVRIIQTKYMMKREINGVFLNILPDHSAFSWWQSKVQKLPMSNYHRWHYLTRWPYHEIIRQISK
jgi:hypothetical protein